MTREKEMRGGEKESVVVKVMIWFTEYRLFSIYLMQNSVILINR